MAPAPSLGVRVAPERGETRGGRGNAPATANEIAGLLRAQKVAGVAAAYAFAPSSGPGLSHESLGLINYAHCSSPIRRYADLHNQHVLFRTLGHPVADEASIAAGITNKSVVDDDTLTLLNDRAATLSVATVVLF